MTWITKHLGVVDYTPTFEAMKQLTAEREADTADQLWLLQHPPVYTLGLAGKPEHLLQETAIPLVKIDRGGQITYHGPGQLVAYLLMDLRRTRMGVRELVRKLEQSVIDLLAEQGVEAHGRVDAPGVYVGEAKIAAIGLRIKNGCTYHGISLNVDMDMTPFSWINPCGYANMPITQMKDQGITLTLDEVAGRLAGHLQRNIVPTGPGEKTDG